jgi:hypothetical protein
MGSNIEFFKVEKNELNNQYLVFSMCNELPAAYAFERKSEANKFKDKINAQANADYNKFKPNLTWKE